MSQQNSPKLKRYIDLHNHTTASGIGHAENTPQEIMKMFESEKLAGAAITDHNTVAGVREAVEDKKIRSSFSGGILPGIEISTHCNGMPIEILGYGIKYQKLEQDGKVQPMPSTKYEGFFTAGLLANLRKFGIDINPSPDEYVNNSIHQTVYKILTTNPQYREFLEKIDPSFLEGRLKLFRQGIANNKSPLFVDFSEFLMPPQQCIDIIHDCGGDAVLAHPCEYWPQTDQVLETLKGKVDGIECYHPSASPEQTKYLLQFCRDNKLKSTGGSDYHDVSRSPINSQKVPAKLLDQFGDKLI